MLLNQCPHNLDLLQWIAGMPNRVQAFCHEGKWHDIEVEDDVTAYLEYPNGATGVFITTTGDAPGTNRFEVTGTKGKLVCEDNKLKFYKLACDLTEYTKTEPQGFKKPDCEVIDVETDGLNPQHVGVLNAFAAHILRGEPLVANGCEGINGLTLSNAIASVQLAGAMRSTYRSTSSCSWTSSTSAAPPPASRPRTAAR